MTNDNGVYNGVYRCPLPVRPAEGENLKINLFLDHSIVDIFINDRWATSIRVFPTEEDANGIEAYSDSTTRVAELKAWVLDQTGTGVDAIAQDVANGDVYTLDGYKVAADQARPSGIYISNGKKMLGKN